MRHCGSGWCSRSSSPALTWTIAERIAAQAPLGVRGTLANARKGRREGPDAAVDHLRELLPSVLVSADAAEGVRSFVERRTATFTGR